VEAAEFGEFDYAVTDHGRRMAIRQADPRVLISAELVRLALGVGPHHELARGKLTIRGIRETAPGCYVDHTVIYRIGEYLPETDCYVAEWPG
jgi:hypothetical protein